MTGPLPRILFLTGRLAEFALRDELREIAPRFGFVPEIQTLPISVVALAPTWWVARHMAVPEGVDRVILPGLCQGELGPVIDRAHGAQVERGPEDLRDLARHFGGESDRRTNYGANTIEILAEINHAPELTRLELLKEAAFFHDQGADVIDLGTDPGGTWKGVGDAVRALRDAGHRVSIDSFDPIEVRNATRAGAELVLSVCGSNLDPCVADWGAEVVAIPDEPGSLDGLEATMERLDQLGCRFRIDPILEPVGLGFARSLGRYQEARTRWPEAEILMGVGNVTELLDADSCAVNTLLACVCEELGIRSVLTTAVVHWARSSVKELDLARRLAHHAVSRRVIAKHLEPALHVLRDARAPKRFGPDRLQEIQSRIRDRNWRLFAEDGELVALNRDRLVRGADAFALFREMKVDDADHAFYLGYELAKAKTALELGKNYHQDRALEWGFMTVPEPASAQPHTASPPGSARTPADATEPEPSEGTIGEGLP
jgi:dihydropteroate synthase